MSPAPHVDDSWRSPCPAPGCPIRDSIDHLWEHLLDQHPALAERLRQAAHAPKPEPPTRTDSERAKIRRQERDTAGVKQWHSPPGTTRTDR